MLHPNCGEEFDPYATSVPPDQACAIKAARFRNIKLEFVWKNSPPVSQNEFRAAGRNVFDRAIDDRRAIVEDDLRAQEGSESSTPSRSRHVFHPLGTFAAADQDVTN